MQLKRIGPAFDRIYRMEQNSNLEKIEQANSTLESKMDALLSGKIDDVALQTDIEQKLNDLETQYAPKLADIELRTKNAQIDLVVDFGGSVTNSDNHDNIMNALNFLNSNGGGTLLIPNGIFKTSPLVLRDIKNVIIKGTSPSLPWRTTSCLKIIGSGDVGVQLSEVAGLGENNEVPSWSATSITLENIRIDADKKVNTGVNGNYGITLRGVTVDNAIKDGIVIEPQAYPFTLEYVYSRNNGRHGLYVKAPFTTVYSLYKCEMYNNDGYGMYVEDGNTALFLDVMIQRNKQGGVKIELKNPDLYTKEVFLNNLLFVNLYVEENGLLLESDPKYDGNCGFKTQSYNKSPGVNTGKISDLCFVNSNVNASRPNGFTSKSWELSGVANVTTLSTTIPEGSYIVTECGTLGARTNIDTINSELNSFLPSAKSIPYFDSVRNIKTLVGNGYVGKRGRMRELHFTLPGDSITPGQSKMLNTLYQADTLNFYPILQNGSFYGINIYQRLKPLSGTLTFRVKFGYKSFDSITGDYITLPSMELNNTRNNLSLTFPLLNYTLDGSFTIGVEVTASSDYRASRTDQNYSDIICELFIES